MGAPHRPFIRLLGAWTFHLSLVLILLSVLLHGLQGPIPADNLRMQVVLGIGGLAWLVASTLGLRGHGNTRLVVAGALALQLLGSVGEPTLSDDIYRYVWEGDLVSQGASPYAHAPNSPAMEEQRAALPEIYRRMNHPEVSAAYPPVAQYVFAVLVGTTRWTARTFGIPGDPGLHAVRVMRVFFALCALLVLVPLFSLLRHAGRPVGAAVLWAWSPLPALEFAGSGHFDSVGILLMLSGLALWMRPRHRRSGVDDGGAVFSLVLATLIKFLPALALLFSLRQRPRLRLIGWGLFLGILMYLPVFLLTGGGAGLWRGLGTYGQHWEGGSLVHRWLQPQLMTLPLPDEVDPKLAARALLGIAWFACFAFAWLRRYDPLRAVGFTIGAFLVLSPTVHPWYLTWVLPFLAFRPNLAFRLWLAAAPLLYWPLAGWLERREWIEPEWMGPAFSIGFGVLLLLGMAFAPRRPVAAA